MWDQSLLSWFTCSTLSLSDSSVLVVHPGGSLGVMKVLDIIVQVKKDLRCIKRMFKNVTEVWSRVVPRKVWCRSVTPPHVLNIHMKKVRPHTGSFMKVIRGCTVSTSNTRIYTHTTFSLSIHLFFSVEVKWKLLSCVQLFATLWTVQSVEFSRPEYCSGQPFPFPGDLPNPGIFQILFPFRLFHNIEQSSLCYTIGPYWSSI